MMARAPVTIKIVDFSDDEELMSPNESNDATTNETYDIPEHIFDNVPRSGVPELYTYGPEFMDQNGSVRRLDACEMIPKAQKNEKGRVMCLFCPKTFKSNGIYKLHEKIHTGRGAYSCNVCQKVFGQRSHFVDHVAIHSSIRPFRCEVSGCESRFKEKNTLRRHQQRKHLMFGYQPKSKKSLSGNLNVSVDEKLTKKTEKLNLKQQENVSPMVLPPKVELPMKVFLSADCLTKRQPHASKPSLPLMKRVPDHPLKLSQLKSISGPPKLSTPVLGIRTVIGPPKLSPPLLKHLPDSPKVSPSKMPMKLIRLPATELAKIAKAKTTTIKTEPMEEQDIKPKVIPWHELQSFVTIKKEKHEDNLSKLLTPKTELIEVEPLIPKVEPDRCSSPELKLEDFYK